MTELNSAGTALVYSTYLGGNNADVGYQIALDSSNNAYVTGYATSTNFPTTPGAFQSTIAANKAAFVTKLNPTGSALVYSTYLGGSTTLLTTACEACGTSIAIDSSGNAYVCGLTAEANFPITAGAYQSVFKSSTKGHDAFITKLNPTGTGLVFSTFLGGSGSEMGSGSYIVGRDPVVSIAVAPSGSQPVAGTTAPAGALLISRYVPRNTIDSKTYNAYSLLRGIEDLLGYPLSAWLNEDELWLHILHPDDRYM